MHVCVKVCFCISSVYNGASTLQALGRCLLNEWMNACIEVSLESLSANKVRALQRQAWLMIPEAHLLSLSCLFAADTPWLFLSMSVNVSKASPIFKLSEQTSLPGLYGKE